MSRRPAVLLALALACALAAGLVWLAAFVVPGGRGLDLGTMEAFTGVAQPPGMEPRIRGVAVLADPWPLLIGGGVLALVALVRRRWLMAALVPIVLVGSNGLTQVLKPALADPRMIDLRGIETVYEGSWPSGHSTAAMSLALCLVLVVGPRLRPLAAAVGAGYAVAVGYSLVALGHHLPSDVFGGYLVAATFALLATAALAALEARGPARDARPARPPAVLSPAALATAGASLLGCLGVALVAVAPGMARDAIEHPTAVVAAAGIATLGLTLTAGLALVLRR